ncbi:nuclear transport factor 2 family protein [Micromonospora sp. NPDC049523]|uniref:nuclear transport factor 2 family protein n=1 Tax=Micromonospora sp. NPDC049523 TaxID=3155921 RepID=UPI0034246F9A
MTGSNDVDTLAGPHEIFARMQQRWLANTVSTFGDDLAEDVVIETPFAAPGRPRRVEGRAACRAFTEAGRAALPARFEECRNVVVHETADPETIVVEYELAGTVTTTNRSAAASFIAVLRVRGGQVVLWREYQDVLAIAQALGQPPALPGTDEASQ